MVDWVKVYKKTMGKIFTYLGLLIAIAGIDWLILEMFVLGIFIVIIGSIIHEVNES